jgi:hypothetical protein
MNQALLGTLVGLVAGLSGDARSLASPFDSLHVSGIVQPSGKIRFELQVAYDDAGATSRVWMSGMRIDLGADGAYWMGITQTPNGNAIAEARSVKLLDGQVQELELIAR